MTDVPSTANDLRYPIGRFERPGNVSPADRTTYAAQIAALPKEMRAAVAGLTDAQLDTPYRPEGWTVRQVVHHVVDSHINSYVRFRWALTEDEPDIKTYDEKAWATLPDAASAPVALSLNLLDAVHARWSALLRTLTPEDWSRALVHPKSGRMTLDDMLALYAWHGRHHVAHITELRAREGWND